MSLKEVNVKRLSYLLGFSVCFSLSILRATAQPKFSASEQNAAHAHCDFDEVTPLWPHDFTEAFKRSQAWVLSIAAGEKYEKVNLDQSTKLSFRPKSEGSGIIWGANKFVITNAHVVKGHKIIRARTYQRQVLKLELVGMHEGLDLAVLKTNTVDALERLPSACYTTKLPPIGSWVAAVGHPYSMPFSLSSGVVSAHHRGRNLKEWTRYFPGFIQSSLTLNPGNSGGPLINQHGVMLGLNTATRQNAVGMAFTLPISRIIPLVHQIIMNGGFKRSHLGLSLSELSFLKAQKAGFNSPKGVRVKKVRIGGPAFKAGLKKNDIILSVNGEAFNQVSDLSWRLISSPPMVPLNLDVIRYENSPQRFLVNLVPEIHSIKIKSKK